LAKQCDRAPSHRRRFDNSSPDRSSNPASCSVAARSSNRTLLGLIDSAKFIARGWGALHGIGGVKWGACV
jgi:hypothetical protein